MPPRNEEEEESSLYFHVSDPPYENYFLANRFVSCQTVLASPLPTTAGDSSISHRLLFAWPAGNSGAVVFFKSQNLNNTNLSISLKVDAHDRALNPIKREPEESSTSRRPSVGLSGLLAFSDGATLDLAILGSIRTIRDYTEGHGILNPKVQDSIRIEDTNGRVTISRRWFDEETTTQLSFDPVFNSGHGHGATITTAGDPETRVTFAPGVYFFEAHLDYPHTPFLHHDQLLKPAFHHLISQQPDPVMSLSFLSTSSKILTGAWRFFTYFGRDSMISLLLLNPILSEGKGGALEVGLSAVLERIDQGGRVCHEEDIGDHPAAEAALAGHGSHDAQYDYKMIDTEMFLPIVMKQYLVESHMGQKRLIPFLRTRATLLPPTKGHTYGQLLACTCKKILNMAKPFAQLGGQTYENLIPLEEGQLVGQWRDSNDGLGGGRYPYDVNTGLMPAALRAIAELARAGTFEDHDGWTDIADQYAEVWETETLAFFGSTLSQAEAKTRVESYKVSSTFPGPSCTSQITSNIYLQAIALSKDGSPINIIHTDACFRLLLLPHLLTSSSPTSRATYQHLLTLNHISTSILTTFPAGLYTEAGILIANPAYSTDPAHWQKFTTGAYHGVVVWTWNSLAMIAKGLEVQIGAAESAKSKGRGGVEPTDPDFYREVVNKMRRAYGRVWDVIEKNRAHLSAEVWSWKWVGSEKEGKFEYVPLSHLPTPDGAGQTESNIRQLWSLVFLALERKRELEA